MQDPSINPFGMPAQITDEDLTEKYADELNRATQRVPLPWPSLEWAIGNGLSPGQVSLVYGPPGASKTFFALNILLYAGGQGFTWKFIPMEDTALEMAERCLAILEQNWTILNTYSTKASDESLETLWKIKTKAHALHGDKIRKYIQESICENPTPYTGGGNYRSAIEYVREAAKTVNLIVIDNMSQISFNDGINTNKYLLEEEFMQSMTNAVAGTKCHLMLIAHTRKLQSGSMVSDMDNIAGSGHLSRLSQLVLCIEPHKNEDRESMVSDGLGGSRLEYHNITVHVNKVRLGGVSGAKIAFDWGKGGPVFDEKGGILK